MKTKTIHLGDSYRLNGNSVECWAYAGRLDDADMPVMEWQPQRYKIGDKVMLVSHEDVSPNATRAKARTEKFSIVYDCPGGIPGNTNRNITRYHGWRGTTNDVYCTAHGLRKIINIRKLKNGTVAITVGDDLTKGEK